MEVVKNLKTFSQINAERCESPNGFNMPILKTPAAHFALGICGEAGEVAEVVKKLERGFNVREQGKFLKKLKKGPNANNFFDESGDLGVDMAVIQGMWEQDLRIKLGKELADVYGYLDLMATKHGFDLKSFIAIKFNEVSEEMGCIEEFNIESNDQI